MKPKASITINFLSEDKSVVVSQGCTILSAAISNKILLDHSCGGNGSCGTCRVLIESGETNLSERNEVEQEFALERGFQNNERLACQAEVYGSVSVKRK